MHAQLERAVGRRHGLIQPAVPVPATSADLDGIHNWSVAYAADDPWRSAGGGVGWTEEVARNSALAEALERYAAVSYDLPLFGPDGTRIKASRYPSRVRATPDQPTIASQKVQPTACLTLADFTLFSDTQLAAPDFPHATTFVGESELTDAYRLTTNEPVLVPAALVGLTDAYGALPTSSGLAAGPTAEHALLRAVQELIERDAYMATWLHGLVPPRSELGAGYTDPVTDRSGWVVAYDITPAYSSHAVAMVVGNLPMEGAPRVSLGIACRAEWADAVDKAYLEWSQGVIFAGYRTRREPGLRFADASEVRDFDDHAVYYTVHPDRWEALPFMTATAPTVNDRTGPADPGLGSLVHQLDGEGIRLFYRDLTLIDLRQIGLHVVRVLSPELTPIHSDHRWPHLGGTTSEIGWRYPWAIDQQRQFPSPHPHPLG